MCKVNDKGFVVVNPAAVPKKSPAVKKQVKELPVQKKA